MKQLYFESRESFRNWLIENNSNKESIWIKYFKDGTKGISYKESLEEALCFGWIDSLIKKIDDRIYIRKFSPRSDKSNWSEVNKNLVEILINEGKITEFGLKKIEKAKQSGLWNKIKKEITSENKNNQINIFRKNIIDKDIITLFDKKTDRVKFIVADYYLTAKTDKTRANRIIRIKNYLEGKINIL
jgi:uncharacterized protein YdeI (YjbR/CyaY-like superfamily)